jgi:hypothetical protein
MTALPLLLHLGIDLLLHRIRHGVRKLHPDRQLLQERRLDIRLLLHGRTSSFTSARCNAAALTDLFLLHPKFHCHSNRINGIKMLNCAMQERSIYDYLRKLERERES